MKKSVSASLMIIVMLFIPIQPSAIAKPLDAPNGVFLPVAKAGSAYEYRFQSEGGLAPLTWKVAQGNLPPGLSLNSTGVLQGIPTTPQREAYHFVIEVSDSSQPPQISRQPFLIVVQASSLRIIVSSSELRILTPTQAVPAAQPSASSENQRPVPEQTQHAGSLTSTASNSPAANVGRAEASAAALRPTNEPARADETTPKKVEVRGQLILASVKNIPLNEQSNFRTGEGPITIQDVRNAPWDRLNERERRQKELVQNYLGNIAVQARDDKGALAAVSFTNNLGEFAFKLESGKQYTLSTEADNHNIQRLIRVDEDPVSIDLPIEDRPVSLLSRAIIGYSQAGASSAKSDQNYFFDLFVSQSVPFAQKISPDFGERWRVWGDVRIGSAPQQISTGIGTFATNFVENAANLKVNEVAQAVEIFAGAEYRIAGNPALLPSFDRQTKQKFSLSLVAGFGVTTPLNPKDTIQVFKVSPDVPGLPPEAAGKDFIAFVSSDRDRFFRQYYAGFRFSTMFFNRHNIPMQRFPAMLDVMYGQNEYVTGGRLRGGVFRIDGYFPLPYEDLKFINLFCTAMLRPGRTQITQPMILQSAPADTVIPAPNALVVAVPQFKRDYYRIGAGIDFVSFVQTLKGLGKK